MANDLAALKARIYAEMRRPSSNATWVTHVANAINTAIGTLQEDRFYFNESRSITFNTVANQEFYTSADAANIGRILKIDDAKIYISTNQPFTLYPRPREELERINLNGTLTGQPFLYAYYAEAISLSPVPSTVYAVRFSGLISVDAPASDNEASNPWMTKAEQAVRCRAKYELYQHVLMDAEGAATFNPENEAGPTYEAAKQLRKRTNRQTRMGSGSTLVEGTAF